MSPTAAAILLLMFASVASANDVPPAANVYAAHCVTCHGTQLQGGQGPSLAIGELLHGRDRAALVESIKAGYPEKGMPAWGALLTDEEIGQLATLIEQRREETSRERLVAADDAQIRALPTSVQRTELENFRIEIVARLGKPWGMASLPDGRILVTEEEGSLRIIEHGRLTPDPVRNTPLGEPRDRFHRVMLDVAAHPRFKTNEWIYLSCGDSIERPGGKSLSVVNLIRGRVKNHVWMDSQRIAQIPTDSTVTGRIAFDALGHVFLTTASDAGVSVASGNAPMAQDQLLHSAPQDVRDPNGKILRFNDDGSIPADNPFVDTPGAYTPIFSLGHRNPQGLAFDSSTAELWSSEHGPRGGDELNLILKGHNYGWPVLSYGSRDDGISVGTEASHEGMDQPVINWTPEIAVSAIAFYRGRQFPRWRDQLLIGTLVQRDLLRVRLVRDRAAVQEVIARNVGRVRAIAVDPKGDIYLAVELRVQGLILRLVPQ